MRAARARFEFPPRQTLSRWDSVIPNPSVKYGIKRSETKVKTPSKSASDKDEWLAPVVSGALCRGRRRRRWGLPGGSRATGGRAGTDQRQISLRLIVEITAHLSPVFGPSVSTACRGCARSFKTARCSEATTCS